MRFGGAVALGAFLLFSVQSLLGKVLLPWFGGTPTVWTACMLFFQVALLLGYLYADRLMLLPSPARQAQVHAGVVVASLAVLGLEAASWSVPLLPGPALRPVNSQHPLLSITALLALAVGVPFVVLAASSPLLQAWYARCSPGGSPYRLYALSNAGSLAGLLGYPLLVEPLLGVRLQAWLWVGSYALYALSLQACARCLPPQGEPSQPGEPAEGVEPALRPATSSQEPRQPLVRWLALSACSSALLLSVTHQICLEISVFPLLWVLPLAVYLLTFILCFERVGVYRRSWAAAGLAAAMPAALWAMEEGVARPAHLLLAAFLGVLFVGCMVCHGELVRLRPPARSATRFYLSISLGGALGGGLVSLVAPLAFTGLWETAVSLWCTAALATACAWLDDEPAGEGRPAPWLLLLGSGLLLPWTLGHRVGGALPWEQALLLTVALGGLGMLGVVALARWRTPWLLSRRHQPKVVAEVGLLACLAVALTQSAWLFKWAHVVRQERNFHGVLRVLQQGPVRILAHGTTYHGWQTAEAPRCPQGYYGPETGIGRVWQQLAQGRGALRVGVVGLGSGALAAYGRRGDTVRCYEVDPAVIRVAYGPAALFSYLADSLAGIEVVEGDARLSLERELRPTGPSMDLLVLDAFSSDSIPTHLLTREAFDLYRSHLRPDGILAAHLSNRYLDLAPVYAALCRSQGLECVLYRHQGRDSLATASLWGIAGSPAALVRLERSLSGAGAFRVAPAAHCWTDDHANVLEAWHP